MNNKKILGVVFVLFSVIFAVWLYSELGGHPLSQVSSSVFPLFPLDDKEAKYYISTDSSGAAYLLYLKNDLKIKVGISETSTSEYRKSMGAQVVVKGKFVEEKGINYCLVAPCPDGIVVRLEIYNIQAVKATGDSSVVYNTYRYRDVSFRVPDSFIKTDQICSSPETDTFCRVSFEPNYNNFSIKPKEEYFQFSLSPTKNDDGTDKDLNWGFGVGFGSKINSSHTIKKNNTQWTVLDVQDSFAGRHSVIKKYRVIRDGYMYDFNLQAPSDAGSKTIEDILGTFNFR